ncbi:hypothetical protein CRUP_011902, partial [Coryphaenoides rupestris]
AGGWSPLVLDKYQWLEVDLGRRTQIVAVATQGRYGSSDWLMAYLLLSSDSGHNWKQYKQKDSIGAFPGNSNADSVVEHRLQQPVIARYLRLVPLDWNPHGRIGLRLEAYGCPYNSDVAHFDGRSSLLFRWNSRLRQVSMQTVSFRFKSLRSAGGRAGRPLCTLGSLLDDQHWHGVELERRGAHLNLSVDGSTVRLHLHPARSTPTPTGNPQDNRNNTHHL